MWWWVEARACCQVVASVQRNSMPAGSVKARGFAGGERELGPSRQNYLELLAAELGLAQNSTRRSNSLRNTPVFAAYSSSQWLSSMVCPN